MLCARAPRTEPKEAAATRTTRTALRSVPRRVVRQERNCRPIIFHLVWLTVSAAAEGRRLDAVVRQSVLASAGIVFWPLIVGSMKALLAPALSRHVAARRPPRPRAPTVTLAAIP